MLLITFYFLFNQLLLQYEIITLFDKKKIKNKPFSYFRLTKMHPSFYLFFFVIVQVFTLKIWTYKPLILFF